MTKLHLPLIASIATLLPILTSHAATTDNFDGAGTPATASTLGAGPAPTILMEGTNNMLRLVDGVNSQNNHYSYDLSDPGAFETISATFDFRITSGTNGLADGFHFLLIPTSTFFTAGDGPNPVAEEPNVAGAFGVGIDVYQNINNISTHWDGFQVNELQVPAGFPGVNFRGNQLFNQVKIDLQRVGNATNATVSLIEDSLGEFPGAPYKVMEITMPNMLPYENRVQFGARTGGENLRLDLDNVNVAYTNPFIGGLPVAPTGRVFQDFDSIGATGYRAVQAAQRDDVTFRPGPLIKAGDAGSTGAFMRLANDTVTGQNNRIALNRAFDAGISNLAEVLTFDLRLTSEGAPADGLGLLFLPSVALVNNLPVFTPAGDGINSSEEPNHAGALGIGFDVFPNPGGDVAPGVSIHWNGTKVADVPLPPELGLGVFNRVEVIRQPVEGGLNVTVRGTPDINGAAGAPITIVDNFFVFGATNYDSRVQFAARTGGSDANHDLDNISSRQLAKAPLARTQTNFTNENGSGWKAYAYGQGFPPELRTDNAINGSYLRLIHDGANTQSNAVAFQKQLDGNVTNANGINANFDFRMVNDPAASPADGFSMMLIPTATYQDIGPGAGGTPGLVAEEPNLPGVFAVAFDVWNGGTPFNEVSAHWDGSPWSQMEIDPALLDLDSGAFHRLHLELRPDDFGSMLLDLILTPNVFGIPGAPITVFDDLLLPNMGFYDYRVEFVGRTGGANMSVDLDNILVETLYIPEPTAAAMLAFGALGLLRRRRCVS